MWCFVFQEALAKALDEIGERELIDDVGIALIQIAESSDEATTYVSALLVITLLKTFPHCTTLFTHTLHLNLFHAFVSLFLHDQCRCLSTGAHVSHLFVRLPS